MAAHDLRKQTIFYSRNNQISKSVIICTRVKVQNLNVKKSFQYIHINHFFGHKSIFFNKTIWFFLKLLLSLKKYPPPTSFFSFNIFSIFLSKTKLNKNRIEYLRLFRCNYLKHRIEKEKQNDSTQRELTNFKVFHKWLFNANENK